MRAMPQKRTVLFLDFDGVLHPAGAHRGSGDLARLPLLEAFLREPAHQGVQIVISSTWCEAHPFERLRALFTDDLRPRILGVTPVLDEYDTDYPRHEEIKAWLDRHPDCTAWAALDDDVEGFPRHRRKTVVFTDSSVGLTRADLDALRSLLA
jgi:hypothetical protein